MGEVSFYCPNCGTKISMDNSREFGFCTSCGTKLRPDGTIVSVRSEGSVYPPSGNGSVRIVISPKVKGPLTIAVNRNLPVTMEPGSSMDVIFPGYGIPSDIRVNNKYNLRVIPKPDVDLEISQLSGFLSGGSFTVTERPRY